MSITVTDDLPAGISVVDDGPGMTPAQLERAGAVGVRFDETRPGSGLGLAIAMDIVQAHRLVLRLSSRPNGRSGLMATLHAA